MAKKKKGPRQVIGLKCGECSSFNYVSEYNKNNEQLKEQAKNEKTFPLNKFCNVCRKHTLHTVSKKLK